ncbi:hypothetical protein PTKIN_Ptkin14bG0046500 [Pterospermum kingtungense]
MSSLSSSSSSSSISGHKYDVFLSFRGEDTRKKFTDHLYAALKRKGIVTFRDDPDLKRGEEIAPELLKAIQESWCSIIVLSETYAFSGWCLEELAEIVKQKNVGEHKVFPIFYDVDPSHLRKQTGKVKEAFAKHEERFKKNEDKTQRWRTALIEVTNITGWDSRNKHEAEFIEYIVEEIYSIVPRQLIGPIFHSEDFMPSKSSNLAFSRIINALNTNGMNMIGLYGMPGVGKTTLAEEVVKHVKEQKHFDHVVMVTMSQTPNISKIQDRIAESLRLKFEANTEEGKAEELWKRLKSVEKIFIIIDDVWKKFCLHGIGIPFGLDHQDSKILLTTRLENVCAQMDCQENFELHVLSESEAWALFKDKAGLKDVSLTLNDVAKEVAFECKGLPLAIVTVGIALKGASLDEWRAANKRFKDSRHLDNEDVCESLYNKLQLSYNYLKGDNIRSFFLLCSLFSEDFDIDFESLFMLGIGHGLFSNVYFIEEARTEICAALEKLLKSGLLLETDGGIFGRRDNERYVRMHDVIRDFAHWKSLKNGNVFMVKDGLKEWPRESFECCTAISFWNSYISSFPKNLEFPELKILVFGGNNLVDIPSAFFEGMKALRVLRLKKIVFSLHVLEFMTDLRALSFEDCKLVNISSLRNMQNLEILALRNTDISELAEELVTLCSLKSLRFSFPEELQENFPPNLLSRLTSVQELHLQVTRKNNVNLSELNSLSGLTTVSLNVSDYRCFPENFVFPKLQRYIIVVNEDLQFTQGLTFRTLRIDDFSPSLSAFKELFCNVEKLSLKRVEGHKNMVPSMDGKGLNELASLWLEYCRDMEWLMDTTEDKWPTTAFSNLMILHISNMNCLKELCHGPPPIRFLQKLKDVYVEKCKELKVVFPLYGHLARKEISLSNLTSLVLRSLPELECIWKLQSTHQYNASLQSLTVVRIWKCNKLKSIFSTCVAQSLLNLQQLHISDCDELEIVFDCPQEMTELEKNQILSNLTTLKLTSLSKLRCIWKGPTHLVSLQSLKDVTIWRCNKLKSIFSTCLAPSMLRLQQLSICDCSELEKVFDFPREIAELEDIRTWNLLQCDRFQLKHVFNVTKVEKGGRQDIVLQNLQILKLENLRNLKCFCEENFVVSLSLKEFKVLNCSQLTRFGNRQGLAVQTLFENVALDGPKGLSCNARFLSLIRVKFHKNLIPNTDREGLNELTSLTLKDGRKLECLIDTTYEGHVSTDAFSGLVELVIENMNGLKMLCNGPFPVGFLQKLEKLEIRCCMELVCLLHDIEETQAPLLSNLTSLKLMSLPKLRWLWNGRVYLQRLKVVEISHCNRLKYLFSASIAQSLVLLEQLNIEYCDELEHITELEIDDNIELEGGHLHCLLLPKLTSFKIRDCPRLKYVFKITMARVDHALALPSLQHLQLENLINLSWFCSENHPIMSPSLEKLRAVSCPQLEKFTIQPEVNTHVQLKVLLCFFSQFGT